MSRILKRPMFRSGGSTNEGIMHGLVDRKGYADGPTQSEIYAKEYEDIFSKIQPPKPRFDMGQMGLLDFTALFCIFVLFLFWCGLLPLWRGDDLG